MRGFFDEEQTLERLTELGDQLLKLDVVDWESFRRELESAARKEDRGLGGRPAFDCVMMFKILVLQSLTGLSDDAAEFQITDRMTFRRFLGIGLGDKVPDAKTIWAFREKLADNGVAKKLFGKFGEFLESAGLIAHKGVIVDATFFEAPRQRNSREENEAIKAGKAPDGWKKDDDATRHKVAQKDLDARWTKKRGETHYGYKSHNKMDKESKLLDGYEVTDAAVHDSRMMGKLVEPGDVEVEADAAYMGTEKDLPPDVKPSVCKHSVGKKKLTDAEKAENRRISKTRCRIEHVHRFQAGAMRGKFVKCVGMARAAFAIGMKNLVYNFFRCAFLLGAASKNGRGTAGLAA